MVITPTRERQDWGLAAVGVVSSLIVDNQLADLDARARELQYHAFAVPDGGAEQAREQINGPVEDLLRPFHDRSRPAR
jgi:multicomponent Na+:H+ antiporter subunit E